jgi:hypothetical protein
MHTVTQFTCIQSSHRNYVTGDPGSHEDKDSASRPRLSRDNLRDIDGLARSFCQDLALQT